jgi:hypothetical protein
MSVNLQRLSGLLVVMATTAFPVVANAQVEAENYNYESVPDTIDRVLYTYSENFYGNLSLQRQVDFLFGPGRKFGTTFPENEIAKDSELFNAMYKDMLFQQSQNDVYLRTPDLPNPYSSFLLSSPQYNRNQLQVGTEYRFDSLTSR